MEPTPAELRKQLPSFPAVLNHRHNSCRHWLGGLDPVVHPDCTNTRTTLAAVLPGDAGIQRDGTSGYPLPAQTFSGQTGGDIRGDDP